MKKLVLLVIALTLTSCYLFRENGIEVEITNNSGSPISDVKFTTSEYLNSLNYAAVSPDETVSGFLNMSENKTDGSYVLEFTRENGKREMLGNGYYTNGGSLDSRVIFKIEKDTVIASTSQY